MSTLSRAGQGGHLHRVKSFAIEQTPRERRIVPGTGGRVHLYPPEFRGDSGAKVDSLMVVTHDR